MAVNCVHHVGQLQLKADTVCCSSLLKIALLSGSVAGFGSAVETKTTVLFIDCLANRKDWGCWFFVFFIYFLNLDDLLSCCLQKKGNA